MNQIKVLLAQIPPDVRKTVNDAATAAFPGATIVDAVNVEDAAKESLRGCTGLLVLGSNAAEIAEAIKTEDLSAPLRWALVVLGENSSGWGETVPPADWNAPLLTRVFRHAVTQYELRRENFRLLGDLKTVARRISHDLRSPVGSIHTSSDVLSELQPNDAATIASMAEIIQQSSGEISDIVDRVSFLVWASAQPLPPAKIDMADVMAHVRQQLEGNIEKSGAVLTLPSTWPEVSGVAAWTQTIWTNLLRNALQHAGPAPKITIAWQPDDDGFRFTITDRGPGVAAARRAGLFTPFDRLHTIRAAGLGLSMVQRFTALQHGYCGYEQPAEGGTRFYFTLPAARQ